MQNINERNWKQQKNAGLPCSRIGIIVNTVKILILCKVTYELRTIPIKIPAIFFIEIERELENIYVKPQKTLYRQNNLEGWGDLSNTDSDLKASTKLEDIMNVLFNIVKFYVLHNFVRLLHLIVCHWLLRVEYLFVSCTSCPGKA